MISMIDNRRARITTVRTSPDWVAPASFSLSQSGITIWFDIIVLSASVATITIDVAEENPPRNASIANPFCPWLSGTVRT